MKFYKFLDDNAHVIRINLDMIESYCEAREYNPGYSGRGASCLLTVSGRPIYVMMTVYDIDRMVSASPGM